MRYVEIEGKRLGDVSAAVIKIKNNDFFREMIFTGNNNKSVLLKGFSPWIQGVLDSIARGHRAEAAGIITDEYEKQACVVCKLKMFGECGGVMNKLTNGKIQPEAEVTVGGDARGRLNNDSICMRPQN